jgi:hypothetical protein
LGLVAGYTVSNMRSQIFVDLRDCSDVAISGGTISSSPAASVTRYIHNGVPSTTATQTDSDGAGLFGNVPTGDTAINGMSGSTALRTKHVNSVANIVIQLSLSP